MTTELLLVLGVALAPSLGAYLYLFVIAARDDREQQEFITRLDRREDEAQESPDKPTAEPRQVQEDRADPQGP